MIEGLSAYLFGYVAIYFAAITSHRSTSAGKVAVLVALVIVGSIAVFRGSVGTDTYAYERIVSAIRDTGDGGGVEPGFFLLVSGISQFVSSEVIAVRVLAAIYVISLMIFVFRADRRELLIVSCYFLPSYFYVYSMNVLRVGIALNVLLLSMQQSRRNRSSLSGLIGISAITFHYSALIPYVYAVWTRYNIALKFIVVSSAVIVAAYFVFFGQIGYIDTKLTLYTNMESPNLVSGISYLISMSILLVGVALESIPSKSRGYLLLTGVVGASVAFMISRYSYAGLRLLELVVSVYPFIIAIVFEGLKRDFKVAMKLALLGAGIVNAAFLLRRFVADAGVGPSPWLPYSTLF